MLVDAPYDKEEEFLEDNNISVQSQALKPTKIRTKERRNEESASSNDVNLLAVSGNRRDGALVISFTDTGFMPDTCTDLWTNSSLQHTSGESLWSEGNFVDWGR
jgi:hemolysin activation/secretion protein